MSHLKTIIKNVVISLLLLTLFSCSRTSLQTELYIVKNGQLTIRTDIGQLTLSSLESGAIEVHVLEKNTEQLPSFAKKEKIKHSFIKVTENKNQLIVTTNQLKAVIDTQDWSIGFYRDGKLLTRQITYFSTAEKRGFNFSLDENEKLMGGGERIIGMDRRGHRMPLYNRAHYGYTTKSNQMYFSMPAIMSNKKYSILFDNTASGFLDIGKTEKNTLTFEAVSGRTAYIVFSGKTYPELINNYVDVTGKQPMPPRWTFGNYASRFGYKSEQQVADTIELYQKLDMPVDSIILDLYWFGPDIKGHVGNLEWDENTFPNHQKMIDALKTKGIHTILITEPFILKSSSKWNDAVENNILVKDEKGETKRFDFYFGNTGLIDVFDENAQSWFWNFYEDILNQGVAGNWGDLGEPEVHPDDSLHYLSETGQTVRADALHNAYGHQWAKMVYQNQRKLQPNVRPMIMMRSGFAGSQRYGMIPWTGDVSREWAGLKPQIELSLQMGLFGMGYTHSDLGGFAGADTFDKEMYIRWLQYGVFQPIYRPHAQDHIASEPVYHDKETRDIIREFIKLRYRLLPYIYTLAHENSTTGMPLMRPMSFEDENSEKYFDTKDQYLWGDAFLVSPITNPHEQTHRLILPKGVWFDFSRETRYEGDRAIEIPVSLYTLPVVIRAGSFIPMVDAVNNTRDYSSHKLQLHYYADKSITFSSGQMYEDDGESFDAIKTGKYEILEFQSKQDELELAIGVSRKGGEYEGMPEQRSLEFVIHNMATAPTKILFAGKLIAVTDYSYSSKNRKLVVSVKWDHKTKELRVVL